MWENIRGVAFRLLVLMQQQPLNQMVYTGGKRAIKL